jgi:hypothetical protein
VTINTYSHVLAEGSQPDNACPRAWHLYIRWQPDLLSKSCRVRRCFYGLVRLLVRMRVSARTGRIGGFSTARFAIVSAARLPEHHPAPEIAGELGQLLVNRHWL